MIRPTKTSRFAVVRYTILEKTQEELTTHDLVFMGRSFYELSERIGHKFNWQNFHLPVGYRLTFCYRDDAPVGYMIARLSGSVFDSTLKVLRQDLLYAKPGTRAARILLNDFIDFGKRNANHVITNIAETTNIKPRSLEKLGFKKLETLYRMEIEK